jgi:cytochrome c biogenesis protein CcmG, thiol:disulfide interchange protein DsbE
VRIAVALAAIAVALTACGRSGSGATAPALAQVGKPAPDWTLPVSAGGQLSFATLRGHPIYLNFFATWCPPCNEEAPGINALQKKYAGRGLVVVGVDELENARKAEAFRTEHHLVYQTVVDAGTLRDQYSVNGLPVHVFIARDGVIRQIRAGEMSKSEIESAIRALL